ncbi:MAG: PilZ domain-containing protein [Gemmataceae bacterium]
MGSWSSWGKFLGLTGSSSSADEERRLFGRLSCDIETTCRLAGAGEAEPHTVRVRNVSRGGIGLLARLPFRIGELLSVHLPDLASGAVSDLLACVVRCDPAGDGVWFIGGTFASSLSEEEMRRFDGTATEPIPGEQRSWARYPCEAESNYQIVRLGDQQAWTPAKVLNISGGGLALLVSEILNVGELLSVEIRCHSHSLVTLASIVRTTVEPSGERIVGCNFMHELLPEQVAHLLG